MIKVIISITLFFVFPNFIFSQSGSNSKVIYDGDGVQIYVINNYNCAGGSCNTAINIYVYNNWNKPIKVWASVSSPCGGYWKSYDGLRINANSVIDANLNCVQRDDIVYPSDLGYSIKWDFIK